MLTLNKLDKLMIGIATAYFFFYPHLVAVASGRYCYFVFALIIGIAALRYISSEKHYVSVYDLLWILVLILSTVGNVGLQHKSYLWPTTFATLIVLVIVLGESESWHRTFIRCVIAGSVIYVFATILMYIFPPDGSGIRAFWGSYPNGTERGLYMYRAGIADNHSANGTYCAMVVLISGAILFTKIVKDPKKIRGLKIFLVLGCAAVLLTTKRAHVIFSMGALLAVYYCFTPKIRKGKLLKVITAAVVILLLFQIGTRYVPMLQDFAEGFEGQSDISTGRYDLWEDAIEQFKQHPLLGIGWLGFRFSHMGRTYYLDAHNVYVQLLCERGIVGFCLVVYIFISTLANTVILYRKKAQYLCSDETITLAVSAAIQIFCLLYGFTGNFFYDRMCFMYVFACAAYSSIKKAVAVRARAQCPTCAAHAADDVYRGGVRRA